MGAASVRFADLAKLSESRYRRRGLLFSVVGPEALLKADQHLL